MAEKIYAFLLKWQQWPRTPTEKLLAEMFDCSSAQMLAILEALSDTNRRIMSPMAVPPNEAEPADTLDADITFELFCAAEYILSGGGGKNSLKVNELSEYKGVIATNDTLLLTAANGRRNLLNIQNWNMFLTLIFKARMVYQ